jgi:hypothetical protein
MVTLVIKFNDGSVQRLTGLSQKTAETWRDNLRVFYPTAVSATIE